ncbi:MAG TPA: bacteriohemerythrin [Anaeromyxobacter sp.]|nr:bacteriohemerythrin [Anaeromyxobacter sp.]
MTPSLWDGSLEIGHALIDGQHRELFRQVDALFLAIRSGRSAGELGDLLGYLGDYVISHFGTEEALMEERAYPGRAAHLAQHAEFVGDLAALQEEYRQEGPSALVVVRVNARVTRWLFEHIARSDRKLGRFLRGPAADPAA